jgi:hypothetical protein
MHKIILLAFISIAAFLPCRATNMHDSIPVNPADVSSPEAIINALYDVISGDSAVKRNWDRMRTLFVPEGKLISSGMKADGSFLYRVMTVDDYITRSSPFMEKHGFFERSVSNKIEQFGNIAHIFSTYESRNKKDEVNPFARGINSIQLLFDGKRWWIMNVLWTGETQANQLPEKYLK